MTYRSILKSLALLIIFSMLMSPVIGQAATGTITGNDVNLRQGAGTNSAVLTTLDKGDVVNVLSTQGDWVKVTFGNYTGYVFGTYVKTTSAGTGTVTGDYVNLRDAAGTNSNVITCLRAGSKVEVIEKTGNWYKVQYGSYVGYMSANYISTGAAVTTPTPTPTAAPTASPNTGTNATPTAAPTAAPTAKPQDGTGTGILTGDYVNFRKEANSSSAVLDCLRAGSKFTVYEKVGSWLKIKYNNQTGYIYASYVNVQWTNTSTPAPTPTPSGNQTITLTTGTGKVTGDVVNVRSGAGTSHSVITSFKYGTEVKVLGKSGEWYKVSKGSTTGYMHSAYVSVKWDTVTVTPAPTAVPTATPTTAPTATPTTAPVEPTPTPTATPVPTPTPAPTPTVKPTATPNPDADFTVNDNGVIVLDKALTEYVYAKIKVTASAVNVRAGAGTNYDVIYTVTNGDELMLFDIVGDWALIAFNNQFGWISKTLTSAADCHRLKITGSDLNVRETVLSGKVIGQLQKGNLVLGCQVSYGWYNVMSYDGKYTGAKSWISGNYTTNADDGKIINETVPKYIRENNIVTAEVVKETDRDKIVNAAKQYLGVPYVYGGQTPSGFDCSGYVYYVYQQVLGLELERVAASQATQGVHKVLAELQPGDLVFFDTDGTGSYINHVGIYLGDNMFIHSSSGSGKVVISQLSGFYSRTYMTGRNIIDYMEY